MAPVGGCSSARNEDLPMEQSAPHVPRDYRALYTYLDHRYASAVMLTFERSSARATRRPEVCV